MYEAMRDPTVSAKPSQGPGPRLDLTAAWQAAGRPATPIGASGGYCIPKPSSMQLGLPVVTSALLLEFHCRHQRRPLLVDPGLTPGLTRSATSGNPHHSPWSLHCSSSGQAGRQSKKPAETRAECCEERCIESLAIRSFDSVLKSLHVYPCRVELSCANGFGIADDQMPRNNSMTLLLRQGANVQLLLVDLWQGCFKLT